ncbi:MAG: AMP-binding protein [Nocardioides sp.]
MTTRPLASRTTAPRLEPLLLGGAPGDTALISDGESMTYADLADAVRSRAAELGADRRLVVLECANDVPTVVTYLAALAGRHPVLLVAGGDADRQTEIVERYLPQTPTAGDLHPDLALLLSTSGSTGSPKLVRLSRDNLLANAHSIADYLGIRSTDRAMTSLPLHYCYGLSVLNSHLVSGAAVVLTDLSVADECFWDQALAAGASSFAGVPYTFDLLDASGFADRDLPHLRYVTQAGGRMAPDRVTHYAELGQRHGWDLFVMYGQTEATARMAYLPPELAAARPTAVGVPVPGGAFRLDPLPDDGGVTEEGVGELVYTGPNVMMGYAHEASDLARGPETAELRTGDLARLADDGLWEITGRLDRCAKVFGLRVDLDRVERQLTEAGLDARVVAVDDSLHAFVTQPRLVRRVLDRLAHLAGVPASAVAAYAVETMPVTGSGKCDYLALRRHAAAALALRPEPEPVEVDEASLRDLYAVVLGRADADARDSFVGLGGDSLSFVEVSTRLGTALGHLPPDWPHLSIAELARTGRRPRRFTRPVEVSVVLRALAILLVVVTHADLVLVPGGAHVLLAVAGYNLARFTLRVDCRRQRARRILSALAAVVVPASLWIAGCALVTGDYRITTALFLNGVLGPDSWTPDWQFWFLEAMVWAYLAVVVLLLVPLADRWQRGGPFRAALSCVAVTLALRYLSVGIEATGTDKYTVPAVLWILAIGWAAAEARTRTQRWLVTVVSLVGAAGFFGDPLRELLVAAAVLLLLWARPIALPVALAGPLQVVAAASLWIYLTHWQVYPGLEDAGLPVTAILASVVVGVACSWAWSRRRRVDVAPLRRQLHQRCLGPVGCPPALADRGHASSDSTSTIVQVSRETGDDPGE